MSYFTIEKSGCNVRNGLLQVRYELRPDIFPHGYLIDTEINLWSKYLKSIGKKKR